MRLRLLLRRTAAALALLAAFSSIGGTWMLAQTVAWSSMAIEYSRASSLVSGIRDTFDGRHPCKLCHRVARDRRDAESGKDLARVELRFETYALPTLVTARAPRFAVSPLSFASNIDAHPPRRERPPLPPPRALDFA